MFRVPSTLSCTGRTRRHLVPIRGLVHVAGIKYLCTGGHIPWPNSATKVTASTPYEILNPDKDAAYDKRGFHEMVKYHPECIAGSSLRASSASSRCSQASHLERYCLAIATHAMVSEPSKRAAYDWNSGGKKAYPYDWISEQHGTQRRARNAAWNHFSHSKGAEDTQKPVFVGHGAFVLCFLLIAAVGGYGQAARAGSSGDAVVGKRDLVHAQISKDLERTKQVDLAFSDREERIQDFVRRREAVLRDQEACGFPPQEICSHSGDGNTAKDVGY